MVLINGRISRDEEYLKEGVMQAINVFGEMINELEEELKVMNDDTDRGIKMTTKLICDNCSKIIPDSANFIKYENPVIRIFCNEDCEDEYNKN